VSSSIELNRPRRYKARRKAAVIVMYGQGLTHRGGEDFVISALADRHVAHRGPVRTADPTTLKSDEQTRISFRRKVINLQSLRSSETVLFDRDQTQSAGMPLLALATCGTYDERHVGE
jgi:hypothetical protein